MPKERREFTYFKDEIVDLLIADIKAKYGHDVNRDSVYVNCADSTDNNPARLNSMSVSVYIKEN